MGVFMWPSEDGWPYPDEDFDTPDPAADLDLDVMSVAGLPPRLLDGLEPIEQLVLSARFGVGGHQIESMKQLHRETGIDRTDLRQALGSGLAKLRRQLA